MAEDKEYTWSEYSRHGEFCEERGVEKALAKLGKPRHCRRRWLGRFVEVSGDWDYKASGMAFVWGVGPRAIAAAKCVAVAKWRALHG